MIDQGGDPTPGRFHGANQGACPNGFRIKCLVEFPPQLLEDLGEGSRVKGANRHPPSEAAVQVRMGIHKPRKGELPTAVEHHIRG